MNHRTRFCQQNFRKSFRFKEKVESTGLQAPSVGLAKERSINTINRFSQQSKIVAKASALKKKFKALAYIWPANT